MRKVEPKDRNRRQVLIMAALAAGAGAAPAAAQPTRPRDKADKTRSRYQPNSAHIQAYYRTNRY